jgi:hypothetical protein
VVLFCPGWMIGDYEGCIAGPRFTGSLTDETLLGSRVVLKLIDELLLLLNFFEESCVLVFELVYHPALFIEGAEPLRPAQHDGGVGSQSHEA